MQDHIRSTTPRKLDRDNTGRKEWVTIGVLLTLGFFYHKTSDLSWIYVEKTNDTSQHHDRQLAPLHRSRNSVKQYGEDS
jgi:hypothetical protein